MLPKSRTSARIPALLVAIAAAASLCLPAATVANESRDLQKVGEARLKVMLWSIYDSRLYAPQGRYEPGVRPLRLEIEYLRDIRAQDLVTRTAKEWDDMGRQHPERDAWLERLADMWPDVKANDVLTLELAPSGDATFFHNGSQLGTLDDADFGQHFVDIWLSPDTTRPKMRLALIGETDEG
jgi:hypothetical protein